MTTGATQGITKNVRRQKIIVDQVAALVARRQYIPSQNGAATSSGTRQVNSSCLKTSIMVSETMTAATTIDAFAQVPLTRMVSLVLRGENLTDENVVTRNQGGSIDYGAPRTVWAGIKLGM